MANAYVYFSGFALFICFHYGYIVAFFYRREWEKQRYAGILVYYRQAQDDNLFCND